MGSWKQVVTSEQVEEFNELLIASDNAYEAAKITGLNRLLTERKGKAYIYSEDAPEKYHLLLLVAPDIDRPSTLKIVNAMPVGNFDPPEAVRILWTKVREIMDSEGLEDLYGRPMKTYENPGTSELFRLVPEMIWELVSEENSNENKYCYTFKRTPERINEDALFRGPKSRQPVN